jgi:hypothetical protein
VAFVLRIEAASIGGLFHFRLDVRCRLGPSRHFAYKM